MKTMKKKKYFSWMFLFVIIGAMFTSCSSDDDNDGASSNESLVGFWVRYEDNGQYLEEIGFFEDGTCNYTESFEPDDDSDEEPEYDFAKGVYSVKGNQLTMRLKFNDETETWKFTIKAFKDKDMLVLENEDGDVVTFGYVETD